MTNTTATGICPIHNERLEPSSIGYVCNSCLRVAMAGEKAKRREIRCKNCGTIQKEPCIIRNGLGECCWRPREPMRNVTPLPPKPITPLPDQIPPDTLIVDVRTLVIDPDNANKHPRANIDLIKASLCSFGQQIPIVVEPETSRVIKGNGTAIALHELSAEEPSEANPEPERFARVWVRPAPLPEAERVAYSLVDNQAARLSELDLTHVAAQLVDLMDVGFDASVTGFKVADLIPLAGITSEIVRGSPDRLEKLPDPEANPHHMKSRAFLNAAPPPDPAHAAPEPSADYKPSEIVPTRLVLHANGEQAVIINRAIEGMRAQFDQVDADSMQLLTLVCREWYEGKGRELPKQRPEPDF